MMSEVLVWIGEHPILTVVLVALVGETVIKTASAIRGAP